METRMLCGNLASVCVGQEVGLIHATPFTAYPGDQQTSMDRSLKEGGHLEAAYTSSLRPHTLRT
jgi:hypothetical protein